MNEVSSLLTVVKISVNESSHVSKLEELEGLFIFLMESLIILCGNFSIIMIVAFSIMVMTFSVMVMTFSVMVATFSIKIASSGLYSNSIFFSELD